MTDIIESIKQSAGQVLSGIDQKGQLKSALDGIRNQWNELERRRKLGALGNEIKAQQGEMKQLTEALGLQTLSLFDAGKVVHPELARLCERINELRAEIDDKKAVLEALKAQQAAAQQAAAQQTAAQQTSSCPNCQADVPAGAEFCPKCGAPVQAATLAAAPSATAAPPAARTVVRLRCPRCKTELTAGDDFCPTCGVKILHPAPQARPGPQAGLQAQTRPPAQPQRQTEQPASPSGIRFCPSCGAETKPNARFCPICGQTLH